MMEPGACAAPPLPLQEARGLPWSLWRALEKGRRNVFTSLGLCFKAALLCSTTLVHNIHLPTSPNTFCLPPMSQFAAPPQLVGLQPEVDP